MLDLVDEAFEAMLRASVPLSARDIDVAFDAPKEEWTAKLNRPTVNVHLWRIRRSSIRARSGTELVERDGAMYRRLALPRVELSYFVTVWTTDRRDERALLSGLMRSLLTYSEIPATFVPPGLEAAVPLFLTLARADEPDVFSLQDQFKTGLNVIVTVAVETEAGTLAGPPAAEFGVRMRDRDLQSFDTPPRKVAGEVLDPAAIGAAVTTSRGGAVVNASGRFLVAAAPGDEVVLHTDPPRTVVVPPEGGIVFA